MSFNNIFLGIITVWTQAWLKHLNRIILQSGPVVCFFFFFFQCLYFFIGSWCNTGILILVLFVYIPQSSFSFHFCSVFIQKYIQNSRDNAFKHQINMISTKSIRKCRKTWIYVCTTFCAEACSVAVKVTDIENVDGSEKMTDKICH